MSQPQYRGDLVDRWEMAYPNQPFPDPKQNPQMFQGISLDIIQNNYVGVPSCTNGMICLEGILDYECQINNSCYLNLAHLAVIVVVAIAILSVSIWLLAFLCNHIGKLKIILAPLIQGLCCIGGLLGKANCKFIRKRMAARIKSNQAKQTELMKQKMEKMGIQVDFDNMTVEKRNEIRQIVQQYQVVSQQV